MANWYKASETGIVNLDHAASIVVKSYHRNDFRSDRKEPAKYQFGVFAYFNISIDNDFARTALAVFDTEKEAIDYLENLYQKKLKE